MNVAVTGAYGHVGANLVRALLDAGHSVRAVDLREGPALAGLDVTFARADVLDVDSLRPAFDGVEVVFHLAAKISIAGDPDGSVRAINVDGVRNAASAALDAGVRRFVHVSSIHAFDCDQPGVIDETSARALRPELPAYDRSKAAGEQALRTVIDRGLDAVIANLTGVIGPYDFTPMSGRPARWRGPRHPSSRRSRSGSTRCMTARGVQPAQAVGDVVVVVGRRSEPRRRALEHHQLADAGAISGMNCTALAPVPMTATRLPEVDLMVPTRRVERRARERADPVDVGEGRPVELADRADDRVDLDRLLVPSARAR